MVMLGLRGDQRRWIRERTRWIRHAWGLKVRKHMVIVFLDMVSIVGVGVGVVVVVVKKRGIRCGIQVCMWVMMLL